jgi:chromosome segregation ATPase
LIEEDIAMMNEDLAVMNEDLAVINEEVLTPADNFLALRDKYSPETARAQFKTQLIGGFHQEEVINYIIQMRDDYKMSEREMRNEINKLLSSEIEFEQALEGKESEIYRLQVQLSESKAGIETMAERSAGFEEENNFLRLKIAELEKRAPSSDMFEELQQKNAELEEAVAEKTSELEDQQRIIEDAAQQLNIERSRVLSNEITGFKDEVGSIYKKIETIADAQLKINNELQLKLDEQVKANSELLQQLEMEQLRAVKAEDDKRLLITCISELKDSLFSEQNLLEIQLNQISERRNEISGRLSNLQGIL